MSARRERPAATTRPLAGWAFPSPDTTDYGLLTDALISFVLEFNRFLGDFAHVAPPTLAAALARCRAECAAPAHADSARHRFALATLANFGEPGERREAEALLAAMESADA